MGYDYRTGRAGHLLRPANLDFALDGRLHLNEQERLRRAAGNQIGWGGRRKGAAARLHAPGLITARATRQELSPARQSAGPSASTFLL